MVIELNAGEINARVKQANLDLRKIRNKIIDCEKKLNHPLIYDSITGNRKIEGLKLKRTVIKNALEREKMTRRIYYIIKKWYKSGMKIDQLVKLDELHYILKQRSKKINGKYKKRYFEKSPISFDIFMAHARFIYGIDKKVLTTSKK